MNSPCYKCPKRSITCHSNCKDYDDWALDKNEKKTKIKASKQGEYNEYKADAIRRITGKKKGQI